MEKDFFDVLIERWFTQCTRRETTCEVTKKKNKRQRMEDWNVAFVFLFYIFLGGGVRVGGTHPSRLTNAA